tara:strand:- start:569 stop:1384 length:816 start_codon:yes stop_codon:yes gene_type:complete
MNKKLEIYCVTNKDLKFLRSLNYNLAAVGKNKFSDLYIRSDSENNIYHKELYYSELTFHYWFWKNRLSKILENDSVWIGFCQKRRFWLKNKALKSGLILSKDDFLQDVPNQWEGYNAIICEPINLEVSNLMKFMKKGWKNIIQNPSVVFNKRKHTIKLHFDMFHGYGILDKAISVMDTKDRNDFKEYVNSVNKFNPHIMFIAKPKVANLWFTDLFRWLDECEKIFGFEQLKGYETTRLYAYLSERFLSFWFKKYSNYLEWPYTFFDSESSS